MLVTTTPLIEGKKIISYRGIVFGEVVAGIDFVKDFAASLTNIFGGRSGSYEGEIIRTREEALNEMQQRAQSMGANAVVGVDLDYETMGQGNMVMIIATGTAVVIE